MPPRQWHVLHEIGAAFKPECGPELERIPKRLFRNLSAGKTLRVNADRRAPTITPVHHIELGQPRDAMMAMFPRNGVQVRAIRTSRRAPELMPRTRRMFPIQSEKRPKRAIVAELFRSGQNRQPQIEIARAYPY
jgi:hypothetical protein